MKLLRGAWTEGLSGIHPVVLVPSATHTGKILRPLLAVRRAELVSFLESRHQPWRTDFSNADETFTRNRIRHTVLPVLRAENPAIDQALANLAELAREDEARWNSELSRILPQLLLPGKPVRGGGRAVSTVPGESNSVALEIDRLRQLDPALRRRVVRAAARTLGARLTFDETARLLALAGLAPNAQPAVSARSGAKLHLPGLLRAERSARELRLFREAPPKSPKSL
jgi:tRNA(Ile)-lysidine synthase